MFRATQDPVHLISTCIRGYHPLWPNFPDGSADFESDYVRPTTPTMPKQCWFGLFPVRSPLLRESLIIFFSSGYLDVSVLRVCAGRPKPGYPIRKSVPHRSFAPQHGLSQLITSFIAIKSQGIRQLLLVAYEKFYSTNMSKNLSVENIGVEPMTS